MCSSWARAALENLDQLTTPIDLIVTPEETVTVVDPRHPLFGRTLPCLGISNSPYRGRCCIIWIRPTVERHVPVAATNLEYVAEDMYPLPISVESLQQLLHEFTLLSHVRKGESPHGDSLPSCGSSSPGGSGASASDPPTSRVGNADRPTPSQRSSGAGQHVPGLSDHSRGGRS
jgi:hypothetical protein